MRHLHRALCAFEHGKTIDGSRGGAAVQCFRVDARRRARGVLGSPTRRRSSAWARSSTAHCLTSTQPMMCSPPRSSRSSPRRHPEDGDSWPYSASSKVLATGSAPEAAGSSGARVIDGSKTKPHCSRDRPSIGRNASSLVISAGNREYPASCEATVSRARVNSSAPDRLSVQHEKRTSVALQRLEPDNRWTMYPLVG